MKNFSKSILHIFVLVIMLLVPIMTTQAKTVTTLDVTQSNDQISVSGTVEAGTLAVAIMIYDSTDTNLLTMQTTSVETDNTFQDIIPMKNGNYIIKVADYDGGDYMSETVSESKIDKNQDNDSDIKSDIDSNNNNKETKSSEDKNLKDPSKKEVKLISTDKENNQNSEGNIDVVQNMLKKIYNGEILNGINKELTEKIIKAIDNGKEISLQVGVYPLDEQKITDDDVKNINENISYGQKLINYYDISIQLDLGDEVANLTQLTDTITIKLPMPTNLPKLSNGYKRIFKILRIHDGKVEELSTTASDDEITFQTNKFSTYALTYEDFYLNEQNDVDTLEDLDLTKNEINNISNPETGDNILIFISLTFISLLGIFILNKIYKKSKINN